MANLIISGSTNASSVFSHVTGKFESLKSILGNLSPVPRQIQRILLPGNDQWNRSTRWLRTPERGAGIPYTRNTVLNGVNFGNTTILQSNDSGWIPQGDEPLVYSYSRRRLMDAGSSSLRGDIRVIQDTNLTIDFGHLDDAQSIQDLIQSRPRILSRNFFEKPNIITLKSTLRSRFELEAGRGNDFVIANHRRRRIIEGTESYTQQAFPNGRRQSRRPRNEINLLYEGNDIATIDLGTGDDVISSDHDTFNRDAAKAIVTLGPGRDRIINGNNLTIQDFNVWEDQIKIDEMYLHYKYDNENNVLIFSNGLRLQGVNSPDLIDWVGGESAAPVLAETGFIGQFQR